VTVNTQPRLKQDFSIVSSKEHETSKDRKRKRGIIVDIKIL